MSGREEVSEEVWDAILMLAALQKGEHITDGRPCWCQPAYEEGVVIHNEATIQ